MPTYRPTQRTQRKALACNFYANDASDARTVRKQVRDARTRESTPALQGWKRGLFLLRYIMVFR